MAEPRVLNILNRPLDQTQITASKDPLVEGERYDQAVAQVLVSQAALMRDLALQQRTRGRARTCRSVAQAELGDRARSRRRCARAGR